MIKLAYIYQIVNDINDKIYVGKTYFSIERRFREHCYDCYRYTSESRPLYHAMRKYGVEHFWIELLEETNNPEEREKFWIKEKKSYEMGYNATLGGDGKCYVDHEAVAKDCINFPFITNKDLAKKYQCCPDTIGLIRKEYSLENSNNSNKKMREETKKEVYCFDKEGQFIQKFEAIADAARWLAENNITVLSSGVRSHISEAMRGIRKSAYGYIWKDSLD